MKMMVMLCFSNMRWPTPTDSHLREEFVSTYASGKIASRAPRQPVNYENHQVDRHDNHDHYDLTSSPVFVNYENLEVEDHDLGLY